jgi:hypothetical protein
MFTTAGRTATIAMPTLRRILKYTPAVVLGLLVVAWVVSLLLFFGMRYEQVSLDASDGSLRFTWSFTWPLGTGFMGDTKNPSPPHEWLGEFAYQNFREEMGGSMGLVHVPIPLLLTALFPFAIGAFISYRFRIWHYLAYTALVAVELAYYLRWHE